MPYIKKDDRTRVALLGPDSAGELNYVLTYAICDYLLHSPHPISYQTLNDVIGALEGAKLEFYRRIVGPYEDKKIKENGDVYGLV